MGECWEVVDEKFEPNEENPEKVRVKVRFDNDSKEDRWFSFTPNQVETGRWRKHVNKHCRKQKCSKEKLNIVGESGEA